MDVDAMLQSNAVLFTAVAGLAALAFLLARRSKAAPERQPEPPVAASVEPEEPAAEETKQQQPQGPSNKELKRLAAQRKKRKTTESQIESHPLLAGALKGHSNVVTGVAVSPCGRFAVTASRDGKLMVFTRAQGGEEAADAPWERTQTLNVERDHCSAVAVGGNSKFVVAATAESRQLVVYGVSNKLRLQQLNAFPTSHGATIASICLLDVDKWCVIATTAASDEETTVEFWGPRGNQLGVVETQQIANVGAFSSPDNRFVAVATFLPEVKILEIERDGSGDFARAARAMTLSGQHRAGVNSLSFSGDSTRVASGSKDGTWRVWAVDVFYANGQDPRVVASGDASGPVDSVALSPDASLVAVGVGAALELYDVASGHLVDAIAEAMPGKIGQMVWAADGGQLFTRAAAGRHVRVWRRP